MRRSLAPLLLIAVATIGCNNLTDLDAIMRPRSADTGGLDAEASGGDDVDLEDNNRIPSEDGGGGLDASEDVELSQDASPTDAELDAAELDAAEPDAPTPDASEPDATPMDCTTICEAQRCMRLTDCDLGTATCEYESSCVSQGEACGGEIECQSGACGSDGVCGGVSASCSDASECVDPLECVDELCMPPTVDGMVFVPAGVSIQGSTCGSCNEGPTANVYVSSFYMDQLEVTVEDYGRCVAADVCAAPDTTASSCSGTNAPDNNWSRRNFRADHPINCVNWQQAVDYCTWVSKRLPTEAEWEKAARGTAGQTFPWGEESPSCELAVLHGLGFDGCGLSRTWVVGSKSDGRSPYGALNMAGNVEEWVSDWYVERREVDGARDPQGPASGTTKTRRGGGWTSLTPEPQKASRRAETAPDTVRVYLGFRCARELR